MATGRQEAMDRAAWSRTAALLAAVWSTNAQLKKPRNFSPAEFNPYGKPGGGQGGGKRGLRITGETMPMLKAALL